ncbi:MAG: deoxyribodipyrimidine photo-lyase [Anaerolineales bacterium]|nr:deoxyribodipyrimidine photo-lyase [Anaerolineales bacterium]
MQTAIWWIRRDLRLTDNQALTAAYKAASMVIPLFIIDPIFEQSNYVGSKRQAFLWEGLQVLHQALCALGSRLIIRRGVPEEVLVKLMRETGAEAIFAEEDYSNLARRRDGRIVKTLPLKLVGAPCVRPPGTVVKADGTPYTVFTPFSRAWKAQLLPAQTDILCAPTQINTPANLSTELVSNLVQGEAAVSFPAGEQTAQKRLQYFVQTSIADYADARNYVAQAGTAHLSPYLRFGMLSARQAVVAALRACETAADAPQQKSAETWLNELIWREFFIHILYHFPFVAEMSFRERYRNLAWRNNVEAFDQWCNGRTGYPIIDAAMRQLSQTGWMHNRARMLVASFLVKDLLIDWRWGERWFMQNLIDGDPAANNGGWQWAAGTGTDAAPYFRVFNPITQSQKFDPAGKYIRQWLPELAALDNKQIHAPWRVPLLDQYRIGCVIGRDYPAPIVDHKLARQRALDFFKLP